MNDKGLTVWLMIVFGMAGSALLVGSWTVPHLASDRIFAALGGVIGVAFAALLGLALLHDRRPSPGKPAAVEVRTAGER